ncbi:MAG TPA: DMT family transporter [Methylophilaceae bacterium]|nr:DMT family transporter [Methylophilaceae bacterium]
MTTKTTTKYFAVFGLLFGAVSWGVVWYPYRVLQEAGISGVAASFYTYVIAAILGCILFARHWRGLRVLPKGVFWLALAAGWTNLSYILAVIDGEVMRVMLLFYLSPLWTLILAHFWLHERTGKFGMIAIATSMIGAFTMLSNQHPGQPYGGLPLPNNEAEWMALSSGIGFALTNVITRKSSHLSLRSKSISVWLGVAVMAIIFMPFQTLPFVFPSGFSGTQWLIMGGIGLMLMSVTLFVQYGITHIPVTRASVIFLFELVVAAIASYYLANEAMTLREWLGGCLIVAAAIFAARAEET